MFVTRVGGTILKSLPIPVSKTSTKYQSCVKALEWISTSARNLRCQSISEWCACLQDTRNISSYQDNSTIDLLKPKLTKLLVMKIITRLWEAPVQYSPQMSNILASYSFLIFIKAITFSWHCTLRMHLKTGLKRACWWRCFQSNSTFTAHGAGGVSQEEHLRVKMSSPTWPGQKECWRWNIFYYLSKMLSLWAVGVARYRRRSQHPYIGYQKVIARSMTERDLCLLATNSSFSATVSGYKFQIRNYKTSGGKTSSLLFEI